MVYTHAEVHVDQHAQLQIIWVIFGGANFCEKAKIQLV